ncbi:MAG TPA: DNA methyltransferase [Terriglobales bacterium]|nr:DNA methyltransferase [Terriglobales bacterium]
MASRKQLKSPSHSHHRLSITYRAIKDLRPNPENPRLHSDKQVRQISRSIEVFGFNVPVLVDAQLRVIAGHGRLQACRLLKLTQVPTISLEHLTEAQARAFLIADNRLTENADWDGGLLAEQFKALSEADIDFSIDVTGFEMGEIDLLIEGLEPAVEGGMDNADSLPEAGAQVSHHEDLWLLGPHRVYCGNALNQSSYANLMNSKRAAMVFTDPPYNVPIAGHASGLGAIQHANFKMASGEMTQPEFMDFLTAACGLLSAHSVDASIHFVCMDWRHMGELLSAGAQVYSELKNVCVWAKNNAGMGSLYRSQHELVFVFKSGIGTHRNNVQLGQYGRYRSNVWRYPGVNSFSRSTSEGNLLALHPTVKPAALVADAIMDCSARGEIVLDAFLGSGTTVIAAERTGRICYGIELDPVYVDAIIRRWQSFSGQSALHGHSGRSFTELEETAAQEVTQCPERLKARSRIVSVDNKNNLYPGQKTKTALPLQSARKVRSPKLSATAILRRTPASRKESRATRKAVPRVSITSRKCLPKRLMKGSSSTKTVNGRGLPSLKRQSNN